jgi:large subunit ribosomal protein L18
VTTTAKAARKRTMRIRRHNRVRKHITGTAARPRLAVFRSSRHISAQLIDDTAGRTIVSAATVEAALRPGGGGNVQAASAVGQAVAERAIAAGITRVVFDRGGYRYHGRVAALAEAARQGGLEF